MEGVQRMIDCADPDFEWSGETERECLLDLCDHVLSLPDDDSDALVRAKLFAQQMKDRAGA